MKKMLKRRNKKGTDGRKKEDVKKTKGGSKQRDRDKAVES